MRVSISHPTSKVNFSEVTVGPVTIWFSYRTPIAFLDSLQGYVIRENDWGPTTGRHLNWINDDKSVRVPTAYFEDRLSGVLAAL